MHYVHENGVQRGPFSIEEINSKYAEGHIKDEALVWDESKEEWVSIKSFVSPPPPAPSVENTAPEEKQVSNLCKASTYCAISAAVISLLVAVFLKSPLQRANEANKKVMELATDNFKNNKNKNPKKQSANSVKTQKEIVEVSFGNFTSIIKGSIIHLCSVFFCFCVLGFFLNVGDAVKNWNISKRNIINAIANVACMFIVIPVLIIFGVFKGATKVFDFLPF